MLHIFQAACSAGLVPLGRLRIFLQLLALFVLLLGVLRGRGVLSFDGGVVVVMIAPDVSMLLAALQSQNAERIRVIGHDRLK